MIVIIGMCALVGLALGFFQPSVAVWTVLMDGLAAVGTLSAVAVAVYAISLERRDRLRAEQKLVDLDEARKVEEYEAQARAVHWWVVPIDMDTYTGSMSRYLGIPWNDQRIGEAEKAVVHLHVMNSSDAVIRFVVVSNNSQRNENGNTLRFAGTLPPGEHVFVEEFWHSPAGSTFYRTLNRVALGDPIAWVEFMDINGQLWRREQNGSPIPQDHDAMQPGDFSY